MKKLKLLSITLTLCALAALSLIHISSQFSLWNLIVFSERSFTDETGWKSGETYPEPDFTIMTAMRASPMLIAMSFLRTVYIVTGIMAAVCLFFLLRSIKRNLVIPLRDINEGMAGGFANVSELREEPPRWAETSELYQHYLDTTDTLRLSLIHICYEKQKKL